MTWTKRSTITSEIIRAFVVTGPHQFAVRDVPAPIADAGEAVVDVARAGVCGTDVELFTGEMVYQGDGHTTYPLRLGHEWCGVVSAIGAGVDPAWLGRPVMGDTMIGDGTCRRCRRGQQHVCEHRREVGIRDGCPGALAEQLAVPVSSLHVLPDSLDPALGALVEPGGNALRASRAAAVGAGDRALVVGPGTIGLLVALFLRAAGVEVHLLGVTAASLEFARSLGFENVWTAETLPALELDAIVDASNAAHVPAHVLDLVEPGGRVIYIGISGQPSTIDTRTLVLKDVTAVGILSASPGLADTIRAYADGVIDPRPLIATTIGLSEVGDVLAGRRPSSAGPGPKIQVDPGLSADNCG